MTEEGIGEGSAALGEMVEVLRAELYKRLGLNLEWRINTNAVVAAVDRTNEPRVIVIRTSGRLSRRSVRGEFETITAHQP